MRSREITLSDRSQLSTQRRPRFIRVVGEGALPEKPLPSSHESGTSRGRAAFGRATFMDADAIAAVAGAGWVMVDRLYLC